MKDRNFVKEIEKLRTAVLGYDREEVVLYIRELVEYYGQKNEEAVRELYLEKMQLAAENAGLRAQIPTQEKLYEEAEGKAEEILGGAKETAATILDHAGAEKERMLKEAEEAGKKILAEAESCAQSGPPSCSWSGSWCSGCAGSCAWMGIPCALPAIPGISCSSCASSRTAWAMGMPSS